MDDFHSVSLEQVDGRWRHVRAEPVTVIDEDGTRHRCNGSRVTDEDLARLDASLVEKQ